jgi:branched-chain amino acid transport system substrate-binding protein
MTMARTARSALLAAACLSTLAVAPSPAQEPIKLGFLTTLSGPQGVIGQEQKRGLELAIEHLGGKIADRGVQIIEGDDKFNAGEAVQQATKLVERDRVRLITGLAASNTLMAVAKPLLARGVMLISANAGPSPLAGAGCHQNLFVTSFQNDQWSTGIGAYLNDKGYKRVYFIGMDYQAGWDHTKAVIRNFKGEVAKEAYTPIDQLDFSAELSQLRAAKPDAVYAFYVGGAAVAFLKQYAQAGLKDVPLVTATAMSDPTLYQAQGDAALGIEVASHWSEHLDNAANKRFVEAYRAKYGRAPTHYAASQYDTIMLLDAAIRAAGGSVDPAKLRASLREAKFASVRGSFRFNTNQFPVQSIYMEEVVKGPDGGLGTKFIGPVAKDVADPYAKDCALTN